MARFEITSFSGFAKLLLAARSDPACDGAILAGLARDRLALDALIRRHGLSPVAGAMEKRARDLDRHITHPGPALDDARTLFWQAAPHALSDPSILAGQNLDPAETAKAMVGIVRASPAGRDFTSAAFAESYFFQITGTMLIEMMRSSGSKPG